jgi:predicted RND superfamily exporter protein
MDEISSNKVGNITQSRLKKIARYVIFFVSAVTALFLYNWKNLEFSYDFEDFLPRGDVESDFYAEYRTKFTSDNDFMLLALENGPTVFDEEFLKSSRDLVEEIKAAQFIEEVISLTELKEIRILPGGIVFEIPYIHLDSLRLDKDSARIYSHPELINQFIAQDAKSLCIFIKHKDYLSKEKCDVMVEEIEAILANYTFDNVRLTGRAVGQRYYVETMQFEMGLFVSLSVILVIFFLYIAFRSLWGILLPQVVLFGSLIWVIGAMGLFREPINVLLIVLPSIMFVVAMSDVIHMVSKYIDNLRVGMVKTNAILNALKEVGLATFLTSVTTAIGFDSLFLVNIKPIQSFGLFTALGVLLAFLLTFLVLPVLFLFSKTQKIVREEKYNVPIWFNILSKWFKWTIRNRNWIPVGFFIAAMIAVVGITQIETNNYLMDDISEETPLKQDFNYLDEHYGGIRPFEMALVLTDTARSFWDVDVLQEIDKVQQYLSNEYGVGRMNSIIGVVKTANRSSKGGLTEFYKIPEKQRDVNRFKRMLDNANGGQFVSMLIDSTGRYSRLNGTIPDWGNKIVTEKNEAFYAFLQQEIDTSILKPVITGTAHLLDVNMRTLSTSMMEGLLLASAIIAIIMGLLYRSFVMVVIALIPNVFPLLFIGGIMGFMGIDLKITTAIIFTIAFGIAVDDTIHFLSKFKLELNKGKNVMQALRTTYISTGKAIILTSLILSSGFLMLMLSSFQGTFVMGLLVSLSLLFAVAADLLLLPVLIVYFFRNKI